MLRTIVKARRSMKTDNLDDKSNEPASLSYSYHEGGGHTSTTGRPTPINKCVAWGSAFWPLMVHGILTIAITCFMLVYVNDRHFNIDSRKPLVPLADGTMVQWPRYEPLQSDITTILSSLLAILRLITACWLGPLVWRCAFILLEKTGLRVKQLSRMITYGIPIGLRHGERVISSIILVMLVIVLPVYVSAPVLTGSITWMPSTHNPERLTDSVIDIPGSNNFADLWLWWRGDSGRKEVADRAAALSFVVWGRETQNDAIKRILLPAARLGVNSTLTSVLLPYFSITELDWVEDPANTLTSDQLSVFNVTCPKLAQVTGLCPLGDGYTGAIPGTLALIPDPPWPNATSSSTFSGKRLMAMHTSDYSLADIFSSGRCSQPNLPISEAFPPNIGIYADPDYYACWAFAWVTFTAGAGVCQECRVSSYATVQNDTALVLKEDTLTSNALQIMPNVITSMMETNSSNVGPSWDNINDHVIGLLTRSYGASWMALTGGLSPSDSTTYSVSPPSSLASVHFTRVYIWLGLQCLVTISGILFLYVQFRSGSPIIGDTTLAAFFLDSSGAPEASQYHRSRGGAPRKVEYQDQKDQIIMKVQVN